MWTLWAAAVLFVVFGVKMIQEALAMPSSHLQDEMREVEEELEEDAAEHDLPAGAVPLEVLEEGRSLGPLENGLSGRPSRPTSPAPPGPRAVSRSPSRTRSQSIVLPGGKALGKGPTELILRVREGARNGIQMMTNPVFAQAFILTFLGEWGDRSQITTIAMAGAHVSGLMLGSADFPQSIPVIAFGTILGHSLCTFLAVMGGRYLSTKISVKHSELNVAPSRCTRRSTRRSTHPDPAADTSQSPYWARQPSSFSPSSTPTRRTTRPWTPPTPSRAPAVRCCSCHRLAQAGTGWHRDRNVACYRTPRLRPGETVLYRRRWSARGRLAPHSVRGENPQ